MGIISNHFRTHLVVVSVFSMFIIESIYAENQESDVSVCCEDQMGAANLFAEALYWYTSETVDWAFTLTGNLNSVQTAYKTFVFDGAPGFRVGLGYNMNCNRWDTRASYTRFQSKAKGSTDGPVTPAFLGARLSLLEPFSTGKASLMLHYNLLDWDLGCFFCTCNSLGLRPFIGLKGGWITQKIHSFWTIPNFFGSFISASENIKQTFKGIGPKGGISSKWCIRNRAVSSFSLIGQLEAGYLWGHWSIRDKYLDNLSTTITVDTSDRNFGAFVLHGFFGFGGDCHFQRVQLEFKIGYEIEDWFNHFQIFSDASGSQSNDLILQGLNVGLGIHF